MNSNNCFFFFFFFSFSFEITGVGKTCTLLRYVDDSFEEKSMTTLGVDFKTKEISVDGEKVKMQVWDTAGQERFGNVTSSFYRTAAIVAIVYDVSNRASFQSLDTWITGIDRFADGVVTKIVLGNKSDKERAVPLSEVEEFLSKYGIDVREISAKDGTGVEEAFQLAAKQALTYRKNSGNTAGGKAKGTIKLDRTQGGEKDKKCAC